MYREFYIVQHSTYSPLRITFSLVNHVPLYQIVNNTPDVISSIAMNTYVYNIHLFSNLNILLGVIHHVSEHILSNKLGLSLIHILENCIVVCVHCATQMSLFYWETLINFCEYWSLCHSIIYSTVSAWQLYDKCRYTYIARACACVSCCM